jgi:hypothetical protein
VLAERWPVVHRALLDFVDQQSAHSLNELAHVRRNNGELLTLPLGAMMMHVADHGSYHRGQLATMFKQAGRRAGVSCRISFCARRRRRSSHEQQQQHRHVRSRRRRQEQADAQARRQDDVHDVRIRRAFPWSNAQSFVSIRSSDGKEIMLIDDVAALLQACGRRSRSYLAGTVRIPRIESIVAIDVRFGFQEWQVRTDRGRSAFACRSARTSAFCPTAATRIRDADGNIYEMRPLCRAR